MANDADLSVALAEHAASVTPKALTDEVVAHLKANLLDLVGVTLGGVGATGLSELRAFLGARSVPGPAVVIGTSERRSAVDAAFANAAAAHALEFDDAYDLGGGMHAGPVVHHSALAVADELGGVSGEQYLTAVALGLDIAVRLAGSTTADFGWHRASVFSVFGATAAAGYLLGLDAEAHRHALGLALSQASGSRQSIRDGSLSTRLHTGFAARNAVTAAQLARAGFTGAQEIFDGPDGFIALFQRGEFDRASATGGLGDELRSVRISTKPFPGGRPTHALVEAALALYPEIVGAAIDRVVVAAGPALSSQAGQAYPTTFAGTYSLSYSVALALALGEAPVEAFVDPTSAPGSVRDLFGRVEVVPDSAKTDHGRLEVYLRSGEVHSLDATEATGSPTHPLSRAALDAKVWNLHRYSGAVISADALSQAIGLIDTLETVASTRDLTQALSVPES
jgi:2-methylcitrate dehydratase PrpD